MGAMTWPTELPGTELLGTGLLGTGLLAAVLGVAPELRSQVDPELLLASQRTREARVHEVVAAGRWLHDGGGLGRNGASHNAPLLRRPQFAWRQELPGKLLGEPRVWDGHVVLALQMAANKMRVEVRRLADGSLVGVRKLAGSIDPAPVVWGKEIVCRSARGLELLRYDDFDLHFVRALSTKAATSAPLRVGQIVYAIIDGKLHCLHASTFAERWRSKMKVAGRVSLLDGQVYALQVRGQKQHAVVALDQDTGKLRGRSQKFALRNPVAETMRMQLAGRTLLLRFGDDDALAEFRMRGVPLNSLQFQLPLHASHPGSPSSMLCEHALDPNVHVSPMDKGKGVHLALFPTDRDEGLRLDSCELHRQLAHIPATLVDGVTYFGACAVDTRGLRILWRMSSAGGKRLPQSRAIPAGASLLLAGERELVALREPQALQPVAQELTKALRDAERDVLEPLLGDAMMARDWSYARDLLARCRELHADERWAVTREQDLDRAQKATRGRVRAHEARVVRGKANRSGAMAVQAVQKLVSSWPSKRTAADYRSGLRFLLDQQPRNEFARQSVRQLLLRHDPTIAVAEPFQAADWLHYLAAVSNTPVQWLAADPQGSTYARQLHQWQQSWRKDLRSVQSERLVLFSPISQPGSLARALATGELVCDALERMFADMPKRRSDLKPMLVFLYADRADYLRESRKIGASVASIASGYYSWHEKPPKSRLYVPGDAVGFTSALPTLAHELTHQWLMDRCTAFEPNAAAALAGPKAFWIVEGFASLVEQFEFDVANNDVRFGKGGDLHRADLVASLPAGKHLDWSWLVNAKRSQFARLTNGKQLLDVGSRTRLGRRYRVRAVDLFYAQSAMLTRYLYEAEDGKYRQQLLDYVVSYYTGKLDELDFEQAFGVSGKELGPRVAKYAQRLLE